MKKNRKISGTIYKVTHIPSGQVYIGATTATIEDRKLDHLHKANKQTGHSFHKAIATFGADAFKWEQIDTANNLNDLAEKERNYIVNYNSFEEGFNGDSGGGIKKIVYQYDTLNGELINQFPSLETAAQSIGKDKKGISRACLNVNNTYGGYYWSYDLQKPFKAKNDKRRKSVCQIDSNGNLLAKYKSIAEASRQTGINKSSIAKVCRNELEITGGYKWIFD